MKSGFWRCICTVILLMSVLVAVSFAVQTDEGSDGEIISSIDAGNLSTWTYNKTTSTLTIEGGGSTYDFSKGGLYGLPPWKELYVKNVVISEGVIHLGQNCFAYNPEMTQVTLPTTMVSIGEMAFANTAIKQIALPPNLRSIGESAFENTRLTSISMPDSLTSVGECAFARSDLASVNFSRNMKSIPNGCFMGSSFNTLTIPSQITSIGASAFSGSALTSVIISDGVTSIGASAFSNTNIVTATIPDTVKYLGSGSFSECKLLTTATIGNGVSLIENGLFSGCISLTDVTFGNSVKNMKPGVFLGTKILESITLPASFVGFFYEENSTQRSNPFERSSVKNILVDSDNKQYDSIDGVLFTKGMYELSVYPVGRTDTEYTVPEGVSRIGPGSLKSSKLVTLNLPNTLRSIASQAITIESIIIPDSVTNLEDECIESYAITIGNGMTRLDGKMFFKDLEEIHIGSRVSSFDNMKKFNNLSNVTVVEENQHLVAIDNIVYTKDMVSIVFVPISFSGRYVMPNTIIELNGTVFAGTGLNEIVLSKNIIAIGAGAFSGNHGIKMMRFPASLVSIGAGAFSGCANLEMVYFEGAKAPSMGYHTFYTGTIDNPSPLRVYSSFPPGFLDKYTGRAADVTYLSIESVNADKDDVNFNAVLFLAGISVSIIFIEKFIQRRRKSI